MCLLTLDLENTACPTVKVQEIDVEGGDSSVCSGFYGQGWLSCGQAVIFKAAVRICVPLGGTGAAR